MAQLTQGQGTTPWEGTNILGAAIAGRETPTGTGLTPEAEHMIRAVYAKELASISKLKMELATQSVTSHANITVALQNARTNALNAWVNLARIQQMDNQRLQEGLLAINGMSGAMATGAHQSYDDKTAAKIRSIGRNLRNQQLSKGKLSIGKLLNRVMTEPGWDGAMLGNELVGLIASKNKSVAEQFDPMLTELSRSGAPITTVVDTKELAAQQISEATYDAVQYAIDQLDGVDGAEKFIKYISDNQIGIQAAAFRGGTDGLNVMPTGLEKRQAKRARAEGNDEAEALRMTLQEMGAGVPREVSDAFFKMSEMSESIVNDGPEAFAESLISMPTPLSVQLTEQKLAYQMDQLDNPTDRLSQAVASYASKIPYFANYMAAMGMSEPYDAVKYLMDHPSDRKEYFKIVKSLAREGNYTELNNPEVLQERLRVAGSSDQDSIFRTSFLTKPIERLFGIGFNRPEAWRHFSGTTSQEQLKNAMAALEHAGEKEFSKEVEALEESAAIEEPDVGELPEAVRVEAEAPEGPATAEEDDDELTEMLESIEGEPKDRLKEFAEGLSPRKRKRVQTAAERYMGRINPEYDLSKEAEQGRFVLSGLEPDPVIEEEPAPPPPSTPPTSAPTKKPYPSVGAGGRKGNLQKNRERVAKQRQKEAEERRAAEVAKIVADNKAKMEAAQREADAAAKKAKTAADRFKELQDPAYPTSEQER